MDTSYSFTKKHISSGTLIGYIYLIIFSIDSGITYTEFQPQGIVARAVLLTEIILFLLFVFREKYSLKAFGIIFTLVLIGLFSYFVTGYTQLASAIMVAIVFQKLDYKKGFKFLFLCRLILMILINGLSLIGIINIGARIIGKSYGQVTGYGLGYNHPNRYAYSYVYLELALICWKNKKITPRDYILISILGLIGYSITKSRTLLVITVGLLLFIIGYKSRRFNGLVKWIMDKTARIIYPLLAILSLVVPYIILIGRGPLASLLIQLDRVMSRRFSLISRVFEFYHLSLFGGVNNFSLLSQKYNYYTIDNGYIHCLFGYGIIGMLVFQTLFILTMHRLLKEADYLYVICAFVIAIWGLSENILINDGFNIAILFWGILFSKMRSKEPIHNVKRRIKGAVNSKLKVSYQTDLR